MQLMLDLLYFILQSLGLIFVAALIWQFRLEHKDYRAPIIFLSLPLSVLLIVLFFSDFLSMTMALTIIFLFIAVAIGDWIIEKIRNEPAPVTKIIFLLTPLIVLGFMDILPAIIVWVSGVLIVLNSLFNTPIPLKTNDYFKNLTPEQILQGHGKLSFAQQRATGHTVLHRVAGYNTNPDVIKAVIDSGADIHARDFLQRNTPLHLACVFNKNPMVIIALIKAGADVNAVMGTGEDIGSGADIYAGDFLQGNTPLHLACVFNKNPMVIIALIKEGADINARNRNGKTPFDLIQNNKSLKNTDAYQVLKDAQL